MMSPQPSENGSTAGSYDSAQHFQIISFDSTSDLPVTLR